MVWRQVGDIRGAVRHPRYTTGGDAGFAHHTVGMLTDALDYLKMEPIATVLAPGAFGLGARLRRRAGGGSPRRPRSR